MEKRVELNFNTGKKVNDYESLRGWKKCKW